MTAPRASLRSNRTLVRCLSPALAVIFLVALSPNARANHSVTEWISTGPNASNGAYEACGGGGCGALTSRDGKHVFFITAEPLVSQDVDSVADVYERFNGTVSLVSVGASGISNSPSSTSVYILGASDDGSRVLFSTGEALVPEDTDPGYSDVYERFGGVTTLESPGTSYFLTFDAISRDGTHVFFDTQESLVASDTDTSCSSTPGIGCNDVYERSGGTTKLVSTSSTDPQTQTTQAFFGGISADGTNVFFESDDALVSGDTDACNTPPVTHSCLDVYERSGGTTTLVSVGSLGGNANRLAHYAQNTPDGAHVYFSTTEKLESNDTDNSWLDIYERFASSTKLISTGPADTGNFAVCLACEVQVSDDGSKVYFYTQEVLVNGDTGYRDLYLRSGNTTDWVSQGPSGGNAPINLPESGISGLQLLVSRDGNHAFFVTTESLVPEDTDTHADVYERTGGVTKLVSTGPVETRGSPDATLNAISEDGSRALFTTESQMVTSDPDGGYPDVFERYAGATWLISTGPGEDGTVFGSYMASTPDLSDIIFQTRDPLVSGDHDYCPTFNFGCSDIYKTSIGYATPQSAGQVHVSFVPTFRQCNTAGNPANGEHSPPLGTHACLPPVPGSLVAKFGPQAIGTGDLTPVAGNPSTAADEADVTIAASLTDIQTLSGSSDYNPNPSGTDLTLTARLRLTDTNNCSGAGCSGPYVRNAATTADIDFPVAIDCTSTPSTSVGSTCAVNTSADAVMPGAISEQRQTVAQVFRLRLNDSGVNTIRGDADDRIFSTQGIYVP